MEDVYRNEIIDLVKFKPDDFPNLSKLNQSKLKKIFKECPFEFFMRGESIKVTFGMIIMTG